MAGNNSIGSLLGDGKQKTFEDSILTIKGTIIYWPSVSKKHPNDKEENFIQLSNITYVWFGKLYKSIPWLLLTASLALGWFLTRMPNGGLTFVGIIFILLPIAYAVYRYMYKPTYALNIELSSTQIRSFTTKNLSFLQTAYFVLRDIVTDKDSFDGSVILNLGNGTIINNSSLDNSSIGKES